MEGLWEWLCKDRVEEPDSGRGLVDGAGSRLGSFFRASTTFLWLGVTSAERCSPGGSFLVGEEETDVLIERTDNASLDGGEDSPPSSTGELVSVVVTPLLAGSDTGELESAGWDESVSVSIRRELLISALVRPSICLSWPPKMTSLKYEREFVVKDTVTGRASPDGADPRCPVFHGWNSKALLLLPIKDQFEYFRNRRVFHRG